MPAQVFEDALELSIALIEAQPITPGPSYPFPTLHATGESTTRSFRTITLENGFLRVTIVPQLGGRILRIFDKRQQVEILPIPETLTPLTGGRRGAFLSDGIQLSLDGEDRLNSLGPVSWLIDEPADEESAAGVWLAESAMANGLGFHWQVSLPAYRAEIRIEARIHNRTWHPIPYDGEIVAFVGLSGWDGQAAYDELRDVGLSIHSDTPFDGARAEGGFIRFARFGQNRLLAPRQVDAWTATLIPISGLGAVSGNSAEAAAYLSPEFLRIQSLDRRLAHKLVLLTESGETLEATADLHPEHVFEMSLASLPSSAVSLVILDRARKEILRVRAVAGHESWTESREFGAGAPQQEDTKIVWPSLLHTSGQMRRATFDTAKRYLAHTMLGIGAMRDGRFAEADAEFERALLYNADDSLLWWEKALAKRLAQRSDEEDDGERPELLNAHYLAPIEPALRAEAFLSQPMTDAKSPLLGSMAPEDLVEVACLLIDRGRFDLANRWIGEAIRHTDLAMLHILLAYCLRISANMPAEASAELAAAAKVAGPPYPWREVERTAVLFLRPLFPGDAHLRSLVELANPSLPI